MKKNEVVNYVKNRNMSLPEYNFDSLQVFVKDSLSDNIDINKIFKEIIAIFPAHFINLVDVVYVGEFDFLYEREINSLYMDGAIYISNAQDSNDDMKDDIIHEFGHALEDNYKDIIYADGILKEEYFGKIRRLKSFLRHEGYDTEAHDFYNLEYNSGFDDFLFKKVGYEKLQNLSNGLFLTPYSVTSIREYWSTGFEEYFLGDRSYLMKVCPYINIKLSLLELEEVLYEH